MGCLNMRLCGLWKSGMKSDPHIPLNLSHLNYFTPHSNIQNKSKALSFSSFSLPQHFRTKFQEKKKRKREKIRNVVWTIQSLSQKHTTPLVGPLNTKRLTSTKWEEGRDSRDKSNVSERNQCTDERTVRVIIRIIQLLEY